MQRRVTAEGPQTLDELIDVVGKVCGKTTHTTLLMMCSYLFNVL